MKSLRIVIFGAVLLALGLGGLLALSRARKAKESAAADEGEKGPYKRAELKELVAKLTSPIEEVRRAAEKDLSAAGVFAAEILDEAEKANDPRAGPAIKRLKNKLRFVALKQFDYLDALPASTNIAAHFSNIRNTLDKARETPLGKVVMRSELLPLRKEVERQIESDAGGRARQLKAQDVGGQFAAGIFGNEQQFGLILELKGLDPQETYAELTERYIKAGGSIYEFEDIECVEAASQTENGAHTRTGRNLFYGNGREPLHTLLRTTLGEPSLTARNDFKQIKPQLGKNPAALVVLNHTVFLDQAKKTDAEARAVNELLGEQLPEMMGLSMSVTKDGFEERVAVPSGGILAMIARAILTVPQGGKVPLHLLGKAPTTAVAAAALHIDGTQLLKAIEAAEEKFKPAEKFADKDILAALSGDVAAWVTLPGSILTTPPEVTLVISSESKARVAELQKLIAGQVRGRKMKVKELPYKGRVIFEAEGPEIKQAISSWFADEQFLYLSTSPNALQNQINFLDRHSAGLLNKPAVTKALGDFSPDERARSVVFYADMPAVLALGGPFLIMAVQQSPQFSDEVKAGLNTLPPPGDLVREFPVMMGFAGLNANRIEAIVRGPVPLTGVILLMVGAMAKRELK